MDGSFVNRRQSLLRSGKSRGQKGKKAHSSSQRRSVCDAREPHDIIKITQPDISRAEMFLIFLECQNWTRLTLWSAKEVAINSAVKVHFRCHHRLGRSSVAFLIHMLTGSGNYQQLTVVVYFELSGE